jgi:tetratricopeptide (TPR) repeat protein
MEASQMQNEPAPRLPAHVFMSYARVDKEIDEWLGDNLIREGAEVWMDQHQIDPGDAWKDKIDQALASRQFVVAVVTRNSVAPEREWVHYEQDRALELLRTVIPCVFEDKDRFIKEGHLPKRFDPIEVVAFEPDREAGFQRLLNAIRKKLRRFGRRMPFRMAGIQKTFVGREKDLQKLHALITSGLVQASGERQIIGIVGMGGIGKTMLAEELVRRLAPGYPGGVLVESRAGEAQNADIVISRWAQRALGRVPDRSYDAPGMRALLSEEFGEMIVLLDDVDEEGLLQTKELLDALPRHSTRLLTTRRLDLCKSIGAYAYELKPFTEDDAIALLKERLRTGLDEDFQTEEEFETLFKKHEGDLRKFIAAVGCHPLALDLGIGNCDMMHEIPDEIQILIENLAQGVRGFDRDIADEAADRNDDLAMSLEYSLGRLKRRDEKKKTDWVYRYRALGILPDGSKAPAELICRLWGDEGKKSKRFRAAQKGLRRRAMLRVDSEGYFYNHPVIRAYATGLLRRQEEQLRTVSSRYQRWVIDRAFEEFGSPQEKWLAHWLIDHIQKVNHDLSGEIQRLVGRLDRLARPEPLVEPMLGAVRDLASNLVDRGIRFARAIREFVIRRPEWGEERTTSLRIGLICSRAMDSMSDEVIFLKRLGGALSKGHPELAGDYLSGALELAIKSEDERQIAEIQSYYGELDRMQGRWNSAIERLTQALELHRKHGDEAMQSKTLKYMGEVYWRKTEFTQARKCYDQAQSIYRKSGNLAGEGDIYNKLGSIEFNRGNHEDAIELFLKALKLHEQVGDHAMQAEDKNDMGAANRYIGNKETALGLFKEACKLDEEIGALRHESIVRCNIAGTLCDLEKYDDALREAKAARHLGDEVGDPIPRTWSRCWEAAALRGRERFEEAETALREALEISRGTENPRGLAGVLSMLASLLAETPVGRKEARDLYGEAVTVMEKTGLDQAFGGKRLNEIRKARAALGNQDG